MTHCPVFCKVPLELQYALGISFSLYYYCPTPFTYMKDEQIKWLPTGIVMSHDYPITYIR